jgi:hypothetical protein
VEIRQNTHVTFHYVNTKENPADIATRGFSPEELQDSALWWNGPQWLASEQSLWPDEMALVVKEPTPTEQPSAVAIFNVQVVDELVINPERFISWRTLVKTLAYCRRFYGNLRNNEKRSGPLEAYEHKDAQVMAFKIAQAH